MANGIHIVGGGKKNTFHRLNQEKSTYITRVKTIK
jgi:hypothetical protein